MFKGHALGYALVLFLFGGYSLLQLSAPSDQDRQAYHELIAQSDNQQSLKKDAEGKTRQQRTHVTKDLFITKGNERLQMRLHSASSDLLYEQHGDQGEITERFEDLHCLLQDAFLGAEKQKIRQIDAKKGLYYYKTQKLIAEGVEMVHFIAPGNGLTAYSNSCTALMKGTANQVEISLDDPHQTLRAQGFQATLNEL